MTPAAAASRRDRQRPRARAGRSRHQHRLAVPAALRQPVGVRAAARSGARRLVGVQAASRTGARRPATCATPTCCAPRSTTADGRFEIFDFAPRIMQGLKVDAPIEICRLLRPHRGHAARARPLRSAARLRARQRRDRRVRPGSRGGRRPDPPAPVVQRAGAVHARTARAIRIDRPIFFSLSAGKPPDSRLERRPPRPLLEQTIRGWRAWAKTCALPSFAPESVLRSALCLKLHAFNDTGAIIAAATTSIPEAIGSGRTWDYRFCWLRDAAFVVEALRRLSHLAEGEAFVRFLREMADSGPLQPMYGITGKRDLARGDSAEPARLRRHRSRAHRQRRLHAAAARRRRRDGAVPRDDPDRSARGLGGSLAGAAARAARRGGDRVVRRSTTPACGNIARSRATTPSRRRCAGSPRIAARSSPSSSACPTARASGRRGPIEKRPIVIDRAYNKELGFFTQAFDGELSGRVEPAAAGDRPDRSARSAIPLDGARLREAARAATA